MWIRACRVAELPAENSVDLMSNLRRNRSLYAKDFDCGPDWYSYRGALNLHSMMTRRWIPNFWRHVARTKPRHDAHANAILKSFSDMVAYEFEDSKDPRLTVLIGLNTCGAPRRISDDEVHDGVKEWVQGKVDLFARHVGWSRRWLDGFIRQWFAQLDSRADVKLSFWEFLDDPTRWATSGSAPTVNVGEVKFRNKWAWAADIIDKYGSVSEWWKKGGRHRPEDNYYAQVALKEESTKVRLVLAAPIGSHLRQSYVLDYLQAPEHLNSTVSHPDITMELAKGWTSLCGLDASKFDHNVPGWFVTYFWRRIGFEAKKRGLHSLVMAATEEAEAIEKLFVRTPKGKVKYHKGILSGWRVTSLLDSVISQCCCDWIADHTDTPFHFMVQGDDIMLHSSGLLDADKIVEEASSLGMIVNRAKSTTGLSGEFLKYLYLPSGVVGYPARALRAIFWANPWLPELQSKTAKQVTTSWMTYRSRMLPYLGARGYDRRLWDSLVIGDLRRWAGCDPGWSLYLDTPGSVGGGCALEEFRPETEVIAFQPEPYFRKVLHTRLEGAQVLVQRLGGYRSALNAAKQTKLTRRKMPKPCLVSKVPDRMRVGWNPGVNKFKSFMSWLGLETNLTGEIQDWRSMSWPKSAWSWGPGKRIDWLLQTDTITRSDALTTSRLFDSTFLSPWQKSWAAAIFDNCVFPSRNLAIRFSLALDRLALRASTLYFSM